MNKGRRMRSQSDMSVHDGICVNTLRESRVVDATVKCFGSGVIKL